MATTSAKRNVVDYLWDWAESQGDWARILVQLIVGKEDDLNEEEKKLVYAWFLNGIGQQPHPPEFKIKRPSFSATTSDIELCAVTGVSGVNRLASEQTLAFGKNITIIYGENGSGKTGYGRILKQLGSCYDRETKILPNVMDATPCPQCAVIKYKTGDTEIDFTWDGGNTCSELQGISFFNNACVHISLGDKRDLLVTPIGFRLFELVSTALTGLAAMHQAHTQRIDITSPWANVLHPGTAAHTLVTSLSKDTTDAEIDAVATFTDENQTAIDGAENALRGLNKQLLQTEIGNLNLQLKELKSVKEKIETGKSQITKADIDALITALKAIATLKGKAQVGLKEIAESRGIELWESPEFMQFIKAADAYITKSGRTDYPDFLGDICVYCRQKLTEPDSESLLGSYRKLLTDTTQQEIARLEAAVTSLISKTQNIHDNILLHQGSFGFNEDQTVAQPSFLNTFNEKASALSELIKTKDISKLEAYTLDVPYDASIASLGDKISSLDKSLSEKSGMLENLATQEAVLTKIFHELTDKKKAAENKAAIIDVRSKMKLVALLGSKQNSFSTEPISRKTTKARAELVEGEFKRIFADELNRLRRSSFVVNLDFRTVKGQSKLVQNINSYQLSDILSEGEQKAIALAEFLTELQLDSSKSPVVFDDPVTSLDHKIKEDVAKRLVRLSQTRQIVVFTHSIILFNIFHALTERPWCRGLKFKFYEVERNDVNTGVLHEASLLKDENFGSYVREINGLTNVSKDDKMIRGKEIAATCYSKLRAGLEVLVENDLFNKTVKRYKPNVTFGNFEKVNPELIKTHQQELCDLFDRCCRFTDAHSNPEDTPSPPNLDEFMIDFKKANDIHAAIKAST